MNTLRKSWLGCFCLCFAAGGCDAPAGAGAGQESEAGVASLAAWATIYSVLQHPRCANCHPHDRIPRQGDERRPHLQGIRAGADGHGSAGEHCDGCHREVNLGASPFPPGAPNWRMPPADAPLVFAGRSSARLCRQLKDPQQNGGRSPEQILEHVEREPLVLWGWAPGAGRTPVSTSHAEFVRAMRAWIDNGCGCPD